MTNVWVFTGLGVIVVLAGVAVYYQWRLYQLRQLQKTQLEQARQAERESRANINSSINIICRATLSGQVGLVEASIRISGLMDQLGLNEHQRQDYSVFDKMTEAVRHIPRLEAWKRLPKAEKLQYEREMQQRESELEDFILDAANRLLARP